MRDKKINITDWKYAFFDNDKIVDYVWGAAVKY